jgi:membrane-bound lytic murein transglycosylase D
VAPKTLRPADVARQVGMNEATLREINHIPPRMLVKAGSVLLVPRTAKRTDDIPETLADSAMLVFAPEAPPQRRVSVKVGKRGESVASVAKRYRVSAEQVAQWNKVSASGHFKAGQLVTLFLPSGHAAKAGVRTVSSRPAKPVSAKRKVASKKTASVRVAKDGD